LSPVARVHIVGRVARPRRTSTGTLVRVLHTNVARALHYASGYPCNMSDGQHLRPGIVVRKIRLKEDDGSFDATFWAGVTPEARLEAVWQATLDYAALKGIDASELRLKRSVVRTERH
jgi:hypothetical protein